ncbi:MAG: hypothetical protein AUG51_16415 [Acidobacteria bacterium 13_1_20CM_3_53_8]|nr:MAG: hypothetical protein AUG51_16415 [Acidobacteria bacterium 13_1_20CM_3_53_8]
MRLIKELIQRAAYIIALSCAFVGSTYAQQTSGPSNISIVVPAPSANNPPQSTTASPPSSTTNGAQSAPSGNQPQTQAPPPGSNARPVTPAGQTEQSVQPQTQADQQTRGTEAPAQTQPQTPQGGQPSQLQTEQQPAPQNPAQPTQQGPAIAPAQAPQPPGRESVPSLAPEELLNVPQVAPGFRANPAEPLPELGRVGVNLSDQRPLTVREAIEMALANNRDIEVARETVKMAEFDLLGARGAYDPRLSSLSYYERTNTPTSSFLSGGANGVVTQADITNTARIEGLTPRGGGGYRVDFSAIRLTTNNQFAALNPQYPTALTFNYTQPLWRGFRFDSTRRAIEIAKKNLSLTDAQFRQRTIDIITQVQRAYWDLVFALRNLQIQQTAVRDARTQLEHNRRLVQEGMLAPIDVVSAEAQVSGYEQSMYSALEDVSRAENSLKNLIAVSRQSPIWNVSILPTDNVDVEPPTVTLTDAMDAALRNRPELQQANLAREINQIDQRYYNEQTKPQVDFVGSYGVVGLAGSQNSSATNNPLTSSSERTVRRLTR